MTSVTLLMESWPQEIQSVHPEAKFVLILKSLNVPETRTGQRSNPKTFCLLATAARVKTSQLTRSELVDKGANLSKVKCLHVLQGSFQDSYPTGHVDYSVSQFLVFHL